MTIYTERDDILSNLVSKLLKLGYIDDNVIKEYSYASFDEAIGTTETISAAVFQRQPYSIDTCCIGLTEENLLKKQDSLRFLGAPRIISYSKDKYTALKYTEKGFIEDFAGPILELEQYLIDNRSEWSPDAIIRSKNIGLDFSQSQPDLFDFGMISSIDSIIEKKLQNLLVSALDHSNAPEFSVLHPSDRFKILFELVMAKYSLDAKGSSAKFDYQEANKLINRKVEFKNNELSRNFGARVWKTLRYSFSFRNISPRHLSHIYENTLVDNETRKNYGIHATPNSLASLIVNSLPLENLETKDRRIFEPFCGHAPFLLAASNALRNIAVSEGKSPSNIDDSVHKSLLGIDIDGFAVELARYSFFLANYPSMDSPPIFESDILKDDNLVEKCREYSVILCNPPYESIYTKDSTAGSKANKIVSDILLADPKIIGIILPKSFSSGKNNKNILEDIAKRYNKIHLISLPESVFKYSDIETIVILAWNDGEELGVAVTRQYVDKDDYQSFISTGKATWFTEIHYEKENVNPFWLNPLAERLRNATHGNVKLFEIAESARGLQWKKGVEPVSEKGDDELTGMGILNVKSSGWTKYIIENTENLVIDPSKLLKGNINRKWRSPKVLLNVRRRSRQAWTADAAVDYDGLYVGQAFYAIWPNEKLSLETISAVINSPLINSMLSLDSLGAENRLHLVRNLPLPTISQYADEMISKLVREYIGVINENRKSGWDLKNFQFAKKIMGKIDATVLISYALDDEILEDLLTYYITGSQNSKLDLSHRKELHKNILKRYYKKSISLEDIKASNYIEWLDAAYSSKSGSLSQALLTFGL